MLQLLIGLLFWYNSIALLFFGASIEQEYPLYAHICYFLAVCVIVSGTWAMSGKPELLVIVILMSLWGIIAYFAIYYWIEKSLVGAVNRILEGFVKDPLLHLPFMFCWIVLISAVYLLRRGRVYVPAGYPYRRTFYRYRYI